MPRKRPKFGQFLVTKDRLVRVYNFNQVVWQTYKAYINRPKPVAGIYIGYRTYSSGKLMPGEISSGYEPTEYYEVWLIVPNQRKNPIPVAPEDCYL